MVTRQRQNDLPEIDWDEVLTPPQELAAATRELIPADAGALGRRPRAGRDRDPRPPRAVGAAARRRRRTAAATACSSRTSAPTSGCSAGCPASRRASTTTTSPTSASRSRSGMIIERQLRLPTGATALDLRPGDTRQGPGGLHPLGRPRRGRAGGLDPLLLPAAHEGRAVPGRPRGRAAARCRARPPRAGRRDDRARRPRARLTA